MKKKSTSASFHRQWRRTLKRFHGTPLHESHPLVKANYVWSMVAEQLRAILGETTYDQWFATVKPIILADQMLVLQVSNRFASQWINQHYRELVDVLLNAQNPEFCCYFLSPQDLSLMSSTWQELAKSATSKVHRDSKDDQG
jgi:chromosomal replication initiation ATPase DnaA